MKKIKTNSRRRFLKYSFFGAVFLGSSMFASFGARAFSLSLEDLLEDYADYLIDYVFSNYPGAGGVIKRVKGALQYINETFGFLYGADEEHVQKTAAAYASVGDAVNEVNKTLFNAKIANKARPTLNSCTGNKQSQATEEIALNASKLSTETTMQQTLEATAISQRESEKKTAEDVLSSISRNGKAAPKDPQFQSGSFLSRYGYRNSADRDAAVKFMRYALSPSANYLDANRLEVSGNTVSQTVFLDEVEATQKHALLQKSLNEIYTARVRSRRTYLELQGAVEGRERRVLDALSSSEGISKIDAMEFNVQRIVANQALVEDMMLTQDHFHPDMTPALKYIVAATASKNQIMKAVVEQQYLVNQLRALEVS